ncbi:EBNA-1 nuclear protein [Sphingomonas spermidinifaciens]|uniref:EBNA-1 nuclear protein n=1 Tax=Sphingomonas spermidinifaciens TaxID=1141889 RepID=A0A2A4B3L2_9SPHN|nr:N-acetyltransferase DgcN [Sphingomonas spermidinifaciens]PCD02274.1 EBNA-1 nuclear protein [Sphingomonas spermidinifaciens]
MSTIPTPYLLYLGAATDFLGLKTARGLATFAPDKCVGEWRHDECPYSVGLERLTLEQGIAARTLVIGIANPGGRMDARVVADAAAAARAGLNIAAGLHQRLRDEPELAAAAAEVGVRLFDVRDPPAGLPVGNGRPRDGRRLLTVGTDCSVGKMYATLALTAAMQARGHAADFRATGQTGILVAGEGIAIDAVVADFIAGAVETLSPARGDGGWDLIEGQGSLFHPSFAGVSTGLLHGAQADALVLCHEVGRPHLRGLPHYPVPGLAECLDANLRVAQLTSPEVRAVGVCLNTAHLDEPAARAACEAAAAELGLPATDPYRFGAEPIVLEIERCFAA